MMDERMYTHPRYDADSDADDEQMTHFDPLAELHARIAQVATLRAQLAEAMAMAGELFAELEDAQHLRDGWKAEAMEARAERAELVEEAHALRAERDAAVRRADDAVEALCIAVVKVSGVGWYC